MKSRLKAGWSSGQRAMTTLSQQSGQSSNGAMAPQAAWPRVQGLLCRSGRNGSAIAAAVARPQGDDCPSFWHDVLLDYMAEAEDSHLDYPEMLYRITVVKLPADMHMPWGLHVSCAPIFFLHLPQMRAVLFTQTSRHVSGACFVHSGMICRAGHGTWNGSCSRSQ